MDYKISLPNSTSNSPSGKRGAARARFPLPSKVADRRCKDRALERSTGLPGVSLASPNKFGARSQLMAALYLLD